MRRFKWLSIVAEDTNTAEVQWANLDLRLQLQLKTSEIGVLSLSRKLESSETLNSNAAFRKGIDPSKVTFLSPCPLVISHQKLDPRDSCRDCGAYRIAY